MLTYSFTDIGSDSLYHHLYQCIRSDILSGKLASGKKLPSKRSFAKNLGVSNITVENAYAQLLAEGYIFSIPKKGYYVREISGMIPSAGVNMENLPRQQILEKRCVADFVSNRIHPEQFPFSIWAKLLRETLLNYHEELLEAPPWGGVPKLRRAISGHLKAYRNMDVSEEQIIIGAGTEYLYGLLIQLFGRDKIYAVENPGYHKIAQIYESNGVECRFIPVGKTGMDVGQLEKSACHVAHISPSHHFPTGIVTPVGARYELLGWATREEGRYIIEDDYDSEFRLVGKPIPTLQSIDRSERVVYMNTFTKTLASTIRISYMVLPGHLLEEFQKRLSFYSCTVSNFEQYTLASFIEDGYFEKHINRMRTYYRRIRDELVTAIRKSPLASCCEITEEDAGLHFLLRIDTELPDEELLHRAESSGIRLSALAQYYRNPAENAPMHTFIVNYSGLAGEEVGNVVKMLVKSVLKTGKI